MDRRHFLGVLGAASGSVAGFTGVMPGFTAGTSPRVTTRSSTRTSRNLAISKAVKYDMVDVEGSIQDKFMLLAELGFDGVEMGSPNDLIQEEVVAASRTVGLPIHGVVDMVHWNKTLSDPDPAIREEGLEGLRIALNDAAAYGASTVLLVPAVVQENVSYDDAWQRSQAEIRKVLPEAQSLGVRIAIENVWNTFPDEPARICPVHRRIRKRLDRGVFRYRQRGHVRLAGALDSHPRRAHSQAGCEGVQPSETQ